MLKIIAFSFHILIFLTACDDFSAKKALQNLNTQESSYGNKIPEDLKYPNEGDFSERKMLVNLGLNVFAKQAYELAAFFPAFRQSLSEYCKANQNSFDAISEASQLKADWLRLLRSFHMVESAPFGPYVSEGRRIADNIYSWPVVNYCAIDKNVFLLSENRAANPRELRYNQRGLSAIEYLVFEESLISKCNLTANPEIVKWNNQDQRIKKAQRCTWALKLLPDIEEKLNLLRNKWDLNDGNFTAEMVSTREFKNSKQAINTITDALANIEKLKDLKLGRPLGRHKDCESESCPADVEHRYSKDSLEAMEAHLLGFKSVFLGSTDPLQTAFGIDDMLIASGHPQIVTKMIAALDSSIASVRRAKVLGSFEEQILNMNIDNCKASTKSNRPIEVCSLHSDIREVALILKTEVLSALSLRAPPLQQGDND